MIVNWAEIQSNFVEYLDMASMQEIIITKDGMPAAKLSGIEKVTSFLSEQLVGIISNEIDEEQSKTQRLARQ